MSNHNQKTLKDAINAFFSSNNMDEKMIETRVINSWEDLMGKMIARHTTKLYIREGTLFLYLDNPALKNELSYSRDQIISMVNEKAGKPLINQVIIK